MRLSKPLEERDKAANDRGSVGETECEREGERWIWMMCTIMPLRGFNVTSGPGVCLCTCRWRQ